VTTEGFGSNDQDASIAWSGRSTAAGGWRFAYKVAGENFLKGCNNRIFLATDCDFTTSAKQRWRALTMIESNARRVSSLHPRLLHGQLQG